MRTAGRQFDIPAVGGPGVNPNEICFSSFSDFRWMFVAKENIEFAIKQQSLLAKKTKKYQFYEEKVW